MTTQRFLVIGATGHVGSKIAVLLADRGHHVTALARSDGATIRDPHSGTIHSELAGKRRLEERLRASPMQSVVVRNAVHGTARPSSPHGTSPR